MDAKLDAENIHKAMKGAGCSEKLIIDILCARSNAQRQEIRAVFKQLYGEDLVEMLLKELKGNLEIVLASLCYLPAEFDAHELHRAMKSFGTKEHVLIEILCTRSNAQIAAIKDAYTKLYHKNLEKDIEAETSGHFKHLLVSMLQARRDESGRTDPLKAKQDAKALYDCGEKQWGTDEATFNAIIATQNFPQLQLVFQEYAKIANHDIEKGIEKEFSGDLQDGLLAIVKCVKNRPAFFAERLHKAMKGWGTHDHDLIRLVVSRSEIDMLEIKQEFQKLYEKPLDSFISGDTSGGYQTALLKLIGSIA
jgi:hypothetical protein